MGLLGGMLEGALSGTDGGETTTVLGTSCLGRLSEKYCSKANIGNESREAGWVLIG